MLSAPIRIVPGLLPAIGIGAVAYAVGRFVPVLGGPVVAILIGLVVGEVVGVRPSWKPGVTFASRKVLQAAIVLFGAGISLGEVATIGARGLPVTVGTLTVALIAGWLLTRALGMDRALGQLITYGTAICGASAIATMSVVIGAGSAAIAFSITVIVIYNVLGAVLFPVIGHALGLSQESFGLWAGTAVNDTSSVVAAATVYGAAATSYAIVVKLTRTLALIPLAVAESWRQRRAAAEPSAGAAWTKLVPPFLLFFLAAAALKSVGAFPAASAGPIAIAAYLGTTVAMAAVGMSSSLSAVRRAGWRPIVLGGVLWLLVASSSLGLQWVTGTL